MLDKGYSYPVISRKFAIGRSTVGDIKKNKDKLLNFLSPTERGPGVRKTLKQSENPVLEDALFTWFLQQRQLHVPLGKLEFFIARLQTPISDLMQAGDGKTNLKNATE